LELAPALPANLKVIDLSGDFRLNDGVAFAQHYGREHTAMDAQSQFVYGLTETNREVIKARAHSKSRMLCHGTLLGLAPLVANNLLSGRVIVDAKTGSSGPVQAAATPSSATQQFILCVKPFTHQHVPENRTELKSAVNGITNSSL